MNDHQHKAQEVRLRKMLLEDTGSSEDAESLLPTVEMLKRWQAPEPSRATSALVQRLAEELSVSSKTRWQKLVEWWPLLLLRSQTRVVRGEIWVASALVMTLGLLVTLSSYNASSGTLLPFAILAPVVAAAGVALLYDSGVEQVLELEDSTPASARMLLLARLTLVFGFDFGFGLAGSVFMAVLHTDLSLWPLIMSWLAPMTFLSALAFLLSVMFVDPLAGGLFSLGLWGLHVFLQNISLDNMLLQILSLPGFSADVTRPLLFLTAGVLVAVALWWVGQSERRGESLA